MNLRSMVIVPAVLAACALPRPAAAQPPPPPPPDVQMQVDALRHQVDGMQRDLDEIKALLAPLRGQQPTGDALFDLGARPVRGEPSAKLTLVELTDYQ
jgi:hypothetical protein